MNRVFVYGLLKPGQRLHSIVAPFVDGSVPGTVSGCLYDAGVPAARFDEPGTISGVVLTLDPARVEEALAVLDDLEDEGEMYRRVTVEVTTPEGAVTAHAYEYLRPLDGRRAVGSSWT